MRASVVRLTDVTPQRWRNGGGLTSEVAAEQVPDGRLGWRISVARIDRSGPFSLFPEYARTSVMISGRAVLSLAGARLAIRPGQVVEFAGDEEVEAQIGRSPAIALNIMSDPRRYTHGIVIVREGGLLPTCELTEQQYLVALASGMIAGAELSPGDLVADDAPCRLTKVELLIPAES